MIVLPESYQTQKGVRTLLRYIDICLIPTVLALSAENNGQTILYTSGVSFYMQHLGKYPLINIGEKPVV